MACVQLSTSAGTVLEPALITPTSHDLLPGDPWTLPSFAYLVQRQQPYQKQVKHRLNLVKVTYLIHRQPRAPLPEPACERGIGTPGRQGGVPGHRGHGEGSWG